MSVVFSKNMHDLGQLVLGARVFHFSVHGLGLFTQSKRWQQGVDGEALAGGSLSRASEYFRMADMESGGASMTEAISTLVI